MPSAEPAGPLDAPSPDSGSGLPSGMRSVLVVEGEAGVRSALQRGLGRRFTLVEVVDKAAVADELLARCHFDLIVTDMGAAGPEWLGRLRRRGIRSAVIFTAGNADVDTALAAMRAGASDLLLKPFSMEQLLAAAERSLQRRRDASAAPLEAPPQPPVPADSSGLVGECELMRNICAVLKRVAPMPSTVLLEGESGTGKELAARALHRWSGRPGAFVAINCGGVPAELLESELFGHVKGAFTGAQHAREGLFSHARQGTLFLDEIGEMPMPMQVHLLRVLDQRRVRPVGSNRELPVDVRIVAATNRNLEEEVRNGNFREDLFYRLNVLSIRMPALRERREDIPLLARHFVQTLAAELGVEPVSLDAPALDQLRAWHWPGNVRELKNVIERCLLLGSTPGRCLGGGAPAATAPAEEEALRLDEVEKRHILRVLEQQKGNKSAAARLLGVSRKTLERKMKAWGYSRS